MLIPNTKARASPTVEVRATMLTPATDPAFPESPVELEPPELFEPESLPWSLTGTNVTFSVLLHSDSASALALELKVISAHFLSILTN